MHFKGPFVFCYPPLNFKKLPLPVCNMSSRAAAVPHMAMASRCLPVSVGPFLLYMSTPESKVRPVSPRLHLKSTCKSSEDAVVLVIYSSLSVRRAVQGSQDSGLWAAHLVARASKADTGLTRLCCCCCCLATGQRSGQRSLSESPHLCFSPASLLHPCGGFPLDGNRKKKGFTPTPGDR